jgi:uncharacterized membrane protein YciS (DUF1049 family)
MIDMSFVIGFGIGYLFTYFLYMLMQAELRNRDMKMIERVAEKIEEMENRGINYEGIKKTSK